MTIYKADLSEFGMQQLDNLKTLIELFIDGRNNGEINWFIKKVVFNNTIPSVCLVDDDNNYYDYKTDGFNYELFKLSHEEKKSAQWNGNRHEVDKK